MSECHKREIERLRDIIFAMEQNNIERETDAKQEFQSIRDEIKNKVRMEYWIKASLSVWEVWGSIPEPVRLDAASPTAFHCCDASSKLCRLCCPLSRR